MNRRPFARRNCVSWSVLACLASIACAKAAPAPVQTNPVVKAETSLSPATREVAVRIGYQNTGAPFLLKAKDSPLAERLRTRGAKPEWVEFQTGPLLLEAMRANAVDLGYVGETPPVFAQAGDVPFVYVAVDPPSPRSEAILVPGASTIHELAQLRGKKIALNRGSNVHHLVLRALESAGLSPSDVELTFLLPADARAAFQAGAVDAWAIWDPFYASAVLDGARVLRDGECLVDNHQFYVARKQFATDHAELVKVALDAFSERSQWAMTHPEEAAQLMAAESGISYDALLATERRHTYGLRPITSDVLRKQQTIADEFLELQLVPKSIDTHTAYVAAAGFTDKLLTIAAENPPQARR
jgi:sulfonate transport system substrate-binding protein